MTSVLNVDTIADKAGTGPVALTKQHALKAWANTTADGTTLQSSFNISSLGDTATGKQAFNFSNAMTNATFSGSATNGDSNHPDGLFFANVSSSRVDGESLQFDNGAFGDNPQRIVVAGDLA